MNDKPDMLEAVSSLLHDRFPDIGSPSVCVASLVVGLYSCADGTTVLRYDTSGTMNDFMLEGVCRSIAWSTASGSDSSWEDIDED